MNMMKPITAAITAATLMIASIIIALPYEAYADHYQAFPGGTSSNLDRPTFGYVTTTTGADIHGDPSPNQFSDIDQSRKLDESLVDLDLHVNADSAERIILGNVTPQGFLNAMTAAFSEWESAAERGGVKNTEQPTWTVIEDNNAYPSLFGSPCIPGTVVPPQSNDAFEAAFCTTTTGNIADVFYFPSHETMAANGGDVAYTEVDVAFDAEHSWSSDATVADAANHEVGHFFGLGDLYGIHSSCGSAESVYGPPVMCDSSRPVSTGDINGLYYLYPKGESLAITNTEDIEVETDIAIAELDNSDDPHEPEFVVIQNNEEIAPSPNVQHFIIKPFLDMDENSYEENAGVQEELDFSRSVNAIDDLGLSIVNIGKETEPEMIVSWIEGDTGFWKVYWDISLSLTGSEDIQWNGTPSSIHTMPALVSGTQGIDTVFMDMGGDSDKEMVVIKSRNNGADFVMDYSFVELNTSTGAALGSWTHITNTGVTLEDDDIGAAIIDNSSNRLVAVTYNAEALSAPRYAAYKVVRFDTSGAIDLVSGQKQVSARQLMPLEETPTLVDGMGADAYNWESVGVTGNQYNDLVVLWLDSGITNFAVDRDARYNAHGGSGNDRSGMVGIYAESCSGTEINGMSVSLYDSGDNLVQSGFTPLFVDIDATDSYLVKYSNYGSNIFVQAGPSPPVTSYSQYGWGGDVNLSLSPTAMSDVIGVYNTSGGSSCSATGSITIASETTNGTAITGLYVQLQNSGHSEIDNGFTTVAFTGLVDGTYYVYPNDFAPYYFSHWEDTSSTTRERQVNLGGGQSVSYTAVYDVVP